MPEIHVQFFTFLVRLCRENLTCTELADEFCSDQETLGVASSATAEISQHEDPEVSDDGSAREDGRVEEEMRSISRKINARSRQTIQAGCCCGPTKY